jgi:hypothetical protein
MTAITKRMCISEPAAGSKVKPSNHKTKITTAIVHNMFLTPLCLFVWLCSFSATPFICLSYGEREVVPYSYSSQHEEQALSFIVKVIIPYPFWIPSFL